MNKAADRFAVIFFALMFLFLGVWIGYKGGFRVGYNHGFTEGVTALSKIVKTQTGFEVNFTDYGNGTYSFTLLNDPNSLNLHFELHLQADHYRNGILLSSTYHTMSLTNSGKDWLADNIFNSAGTNVTQFADNIALSASSTAFDAAWTAIPSEITANNLSRVVGAWVDTGTGLGNITYSFYSTGTQSVQLYGLYYDTQPNAPQSTLIAAEQQGAGAVKNLIAGDTLVVTIQTTSA